jgi:hypothetical protein
MIFFVLVSSLIYLFHCCVFSFLFVIHFVSSLFPGISFVFGCYHPPGDNVVASHPRSPQSVLISSLSCFFRMVLNVELAMGVIEITNGDESFRPARR